LVWPLVLQVSLSFLFILVYSLFFQGCSSHFFYPDQVVYRTPQFYNLKYEDIYFESLDETKLHAWHIFPRSAQDKDASKGLIFIAHGNAQNLSSHFVSWVWLIEKGYELFIFDYREYGKSEGESSIEGSIQDTRAALDYIETYETPYFAIGQSLGGTMLINALQNRDNSKIKAVVIDSTFTGFKDIAQGKMHAIWLTWPFQWIPNLSLTSNYDAKDRVNKLNKPILYIHGSADITVSPNYSWQLFELTPPPRELWLVKEAKHLQGLNNPYVQKDFLEFLQKPGDSINKHFSKMKIYEPK